MLETLTPERGDPKLVEEKARTGPCAQMDSLDMFWEIKTNQRDTVLLSHLPKSSTIIFQSRQLSLPLNEKGISKQKHSSKLRLEDF